MLVRGGGTADFRLRRDYASPREVYRRDDPVSQVEHLRYDIRLERVALTRARSLLCFLEPRSFPLLGNYGSSCLQPATWNDRVSPASERCLERWSWMTSRPRFRAWRGALLAIKLDFDYAASLRKRSSPSSLFLSSTSANKPLRRSVLIERIKLATRRTRRARRGNSLRAAISRLRSDCEPTKKKRRARVKIQEG